MVNRWYYGWQVLFGLFLNYMAVVGIMVYTLPLFYPSFISEFGFSSEQVTRPAFLAYMTGAFITPFISPFYDRYSIRKFMLAGTVFMVSGMLALSGFQTYAQMMAINLVFALGQVCAGQVPTMVAATRWFNRRRGIAIGLVLISTSVGGALFPLVVRKMMMGGMDWRGAVFVLMVICGVMMLLPVLFLIRNRPEDIGLTQAEADPPGKSGLPAGRQLDGPTLKQALRQAEFYLLAFATGGLWFCLNGLVQHQTILIGKELGIGIESLTLVSSLFFSFAIVGKLALGWLADRCNKILIMFCSVLNLIIGLFILRMAHDGGLAVLYSYAVVYGIGYGGMFTMMQLVIAEFYAGKSYGRILGMLTMVDIGVGGLGIPAFGLMQGAFGSYMPILEMMMGLNVVIAVTVLVLYRKRKAAVAAITESVLTPEIS
jgi:MFS family permease